MVTSVSRSALESTPRMRQRVLGKAYRRANAIQPNDPPGFFNPSGKFGERSKEQIPCQSYSNMAGGEPNEGEINGCNETSIQRTPPQCGSASRSGGPSPPSSCPPS